jgi:broad specificity phosphatase PhoE
VKFKKSQISRQSAPSPTVLWLVRHAEVEARYQGVFGGTIDMELSPRGRQQAAALAKYLHYRPLNALYASPMLRVHQTLAPLLVNGFPQPIIMPDLREVDFGDWTGLAWEEVQARYKISAFEWLHQLERGGIRNAECERTLRSRVAPCLEQILRNHAGHQVMVACHGGVIRMLLALLLELPLSKTAAFEIDYASITQVALRPHQAQLQLLNFTPWRG